MLKNALPSFTIAPRRSQLYMRQFVLSALLAIIPLCSTPLCSAQKRENSPGATDLRATPTLYVVGYAHLDTQWRWEYPKTISEYLPDTLHKNFDLFEKYPHYIFNFSGANRYRMMKEYYPADFRKLQSYVKAGRWFPGARPWKRVTSTLPRQNLSFARCY